MPEPQPDQATQYLRTLRRAIGAGLLVVLVAGLTVAAVFWKDGVATADVRRSREASRQSRDARSALLSGDAARAGEHLDTLVVLTNDNPAMHTRALSLSALVRTLPATRMEMEQALLTFVRDEDRLYRDRVKQEEGGRRATLALLLVEVLAGALVLLRVGRALRGQGEALQAQRDHLRAQNALLASQRDQLLEQHELLEQQATELELQAVELEEHASELEVRNTDLAASMREVQGAHKAAQASEERYRLLFDRNPMPMWVYERQSLRILAVNDAAESAYGYSKEEFLSMTLEALTLPEDVPRLHAAARDAHGRAINHERGWRHRRKDGSAMDVEFVSHELRFDGRDARVVLAYDVTARVAAEREVRRNADLLRATIDDSPLAVITLDRDLRIRGWNRAATTMLGGSAGERLGTSYESLVPPDRLDEHRRLRGGIEGGRVVTNMETQRLRSDGTEAYVSLSLGALHDGNGELSGIVVILADAGERRRLEQQLLHAQKMEAVGQLAGGVAHDFNNLITVISSYSQLILADPEVGERVLDDVKEIRHAADRAAKLTRQLLAFSRQQILRPQPMSVNVVVGGLQGMLQRLMPDDITLVAALHAESDVIEADSGQMEQVIMNLVLNARDAMPEGGPITVETRTHQLRYAGARAHDGAAIAAGDYVVLEVRDSGVGMSAETQARMFEPFYTTKGIGSGTGLGLAMVYGIVRQTGGHLMVRSVEGEGTVFTLYFPLAADVGEAPGDASVAAPPAPAPTGKTVLLVEDDSALRAVASRALERAGYKIIPAHNGREALEVLERSGAAIQLVITDMVMPEMNGQDLRVALRARYPTVRVLMMSGYSPDLVTRQGLEQDDVSFLDKPFTPDQLVRAAERALAGDG